MRIRLTFVLLTVSSLFAIIHAQEKNYIFNKLNTENGLSSNIVNDFLQDTHGFIWIATGNGLNRFDGKHVRQYTHTPNLPTSIIDNEIWTLHLDSHGQLWIGTETGLSKYRPETDDFKNFIFSHKQVSIRNERITSIMANRSGQLWIYSSGSHRLYLIDPKTDSILWATDSELNFYQNWVAGEPLFVDSHNRLWLINPSNVRCVKYEGGSCKTLYNFQGNLSSDIVFNPRFTFVFEDSRRNIYIANNGLYQLNETPSGATLTRLDIFGSPLPRNDADFGINAICEDTRRNLWISTNHHGLIIYNTENQKANPLKDNTYSIDRTINTHTDRADNIWIYAEKAIYVKMPTQKDLIRFAHQASAPNGISSYRAEMMTKQKIIMDNSGVHWFNTISNGINFFSLERSQFALFQSKEGSSNSLSSGEVRGICEDHKGRVWIGTNGIDMYDPNTGVVYNFNEHTHPELRYLSGRVIAICEVYPNNLFVSVRGRIIWYEYKNNKLREVTYFAPNKNMSNSPTDWFPRFLYKDSRNRIWMGRGSGASCYQLPGSSSDEGVFVNYRYDPDNPASFPESDLWSVFEDSKGRIWFFGKRLSILSADGKHFSIITPTHNNDTITRVDARCGLESPTGVFWIATERNGLLRYDEASDSFEQYNSQSGLPTDKLFSVFEGSNGILWLSSSKGLIRFSTDTGKSVLFNKNDGLQDNEFSVGAWQRGQYSGNIYIGGNKGMNAFHPDSIKTSNYTPRIVLTDFKLFHNSVHAGQRINNRVIMQHPIHLMNQLVLLHNENVFSIDFSALHFSAPQKIQYKYMLEGFDKEWVVVDYLQSSANYSGLKPGNYSLRVQSTNCDGIWQNNEIVLQITIVPPWWLTWWAYLIYSVVFLSVALIIRFTITIQTRLKDAYEYEKLEHKKDKEVQRIKTEFFMNISHEFRTPLMLITGPLEKLISSTNLQDSIQAQLQLIYRNANRLLRLINQLLDLRKLETKTVNLNLTKGNLIQFIKNILEEFRNMAERHSISCQLDAPSNLKDAENCYFDSDIIEKIMYNLLSNAFKYTPDGKEIIISISTERNPDFITIEVIDNGIGIAPEHLPHIFDRFYQVKNNTVRKQSGTGIGLALTKELTELHGGKILAYSTLNKGSRFILHIPSTLQPESESQTETVQYPQRQLGKYPHTTNMLTFDTPSLSQTTNENQYVAGYQTILLIDDNPDIRLYLKDELKEYYQVHLAENGVSGLNLALQTIPDLIITDIMMPEMSGFEFCEMIKTNELTCHIPVLLITASTSDSNKKKGLETGADDYILKPFNVELLLLKIRNILQTNKNLKERYANRIQTPLSHIAKNKTENLFISRLNTILDTAIADETFDTDALSEKIGIGKTQLYNKIKGLTGQSTAEFIKTCRLKKAAELLRNTDNSISEIAYRVGFKTAPHFTRLFKQQFGITPSEYKQTEK